MHRFGIIHMYGSIRHALFYLESFGNALLGPSWLLLVLVGVLVPPIRYQLTKMMV